MKMSKNELIERIQSGIARFLNEMEPCWSKRTLKGAINSLGYKHEVTDDEVQDALKYLEKAGSIKIVGKEECYFIILKKEMEKYLDGFYLKESIKQMDILLKKYS